MREGPRPRLIVTGREGQLVRSMAERAPACGVDVILIGRPELDLARPTDFAPLFREYAPSAIVNAAAYTRVDDAESDPMAMAINGEGAGAVARAAHALGVPVVQISTDYVFDGSLERPYREDDPTAPVNGYGRSKLAGEEAVARATSNHAILRTSWVYSPFGRNFARTMLTLARSREAVTVVRDQHGSPTSALDLAEGVIGVAAAMVAHPDASGMRGVFHMSGGGETNWATFAEAIFAESRARGGPHARVEPIPSCAYPTPARRPVNSRLNCARLERTFGIALPDWRLSVGELVERCLAEG